MRKPRSPRRAAPSDGGHSVLSRSPRATLFFLGAIGLLLWGRLLLKEVPQTASAVDAPAAAAEAPSVLVPAEKSADSTRSAGKVGP